MIIILCLYLVALWAVFSKFKLVRWGWLSGTVSLLVGGFILATFLALFNYLTPSGRVTVTGRVVEVTPNVTGQIVAIPVKPNVPVKANDVLFQIDPAPFQYKVAQLQASLAAAKQQRRDPESELRTGNGECHGPHHAGRLQQEASRRHPDACSGRCQHGNFRRRISQSSTRPCSAQLGAPRPRSRAPSSRWIPRSAASTPRRADFRRSSITPTGNCRRRQFAHRRTVTSPLVTVTVGDRALQMHSAMSFIVENEITLVGMFSQNGFQTIKEGAAVDIVFDNAPGAHLSRQDHGHSEGHRPGAGRRVRDAGAHQCARRGDGVSGGDLDS